MNRFSVCVVALALLVVPLCHGQKLEKQSAKSSPSKAKAEEVYIPKDLEDSFEQLKKLLTADDIEEIRKSTEEDLAQYHHGLGTGLRNSWGLWGESRLAKYFNRLGIHHPDDMSGIILTSFWRHLNGKPLQVEEQVADYKKYWEEEDKAEKDERERVRQVKRRIPKMLMGLSLSKKNVQRVKMPNRIDEALRVRFLSPFRGGAFLTVPSVMNHDGNDFQTRGYFFDPNDQKVHPIRVSEIQEVHSAVVAGDHAWFLGRTDKKVHLISIRGKERINVPLPRTGGVIPQLGIAGGSLLTVYPDAVFQLNGSKWTQLYAGTLKLPRSGPPPQLIGNRLFLRDEGRGENNKRLWWLEIGPNPKLTSFDNDIGLVGREGPRWENSFSYCVTPEGDLWATLGEGYARKSLVKRSPTGEYRIAIINNSLRFDGELFGSERGDQGLSASAVAIGKNGELLLAGDQGFYRLNDRTLVQEVAFENTHQKIPSDGGKSLYHWSWDPSKILVLSENRYLISGDFGGVYILKQDGNGKFQLVALDQELGKPLTF